MTDHIFAATLTFALLAGGTVAIGSELTGAKGARAAATRSAAQATPALSVTLPTVMVTGRRPASTALASETRVVPTQRVQ